VLLSDGDCAVVVGPVVLLQILHGCTDHGLQGTNTGQQRDRQGLKGAGNALLQVVNSRLPLKRTLKLMEGPALPLVENPQRLLLHAREGTSSVLHPAAADGFPRLSA